MTESVRIETVTPERAKKWLEGNVDNRRLREIRVLQLARILTNGEWELTGDAIVFDDQGVLINGQHRLSALVVANVSARLLILRGVPTKTQEVMDQNLSRSLGDQLQRRGFSNVNVIATALQWTYQLRYMEETGNVHYADQSLRPSLRQLLHLFEENMELVEEAQSISKLTYYIKTRPGPTLAAKHRLIRIDAEEAEIFFKSLQEGTGLSTNDPIRRLREWCIADKTSGVHRGGRAPAYRYLALVFKSWNNWREGNQVQRINWVFSGTKREPWPIPK